MAALTSSTARLVSLAGSLRWPDKSVLSWPNIIVDFRGHDVGLPDWRAVG
jgi:hypothetical protein